MDGADEELIRQGWDPLDGRKGRREDQTREDTAKGSVNWLKMKGTE